MKLIDLPPVWLAGFAVLTYWIGTLDLFTVRPGFEFLGFAVEPYTFGFGGLAFIAAGIVATIVAVLELGRHRTTVIPHRDADALVKSGIFAFSRNPIYLADVLILTGLILIWKAPLAILLLPVFVWILRTRFILPEEARLQAKFGAAFDDYCDMTRRWI